MIPRLNTKVLLRARFEFAAVDDGVIAWSILQCGPHDLLLTDNAMPCVSGFELARSICSSLLALPIVLAMGAVPTEELSQLASLKPIIMLLKPYSPDHLVATVTGVLRASDGSAA